MKFRFSLISPYLLIVLCLPFHASALNVLFINPAEAGQPNWDRAQQLIEIAAKQLDIKLRITHSNQKKRSNVLPLLEALENKHTRPEAVIFLASQHDDNYQLFSFLEEQKLPFITLENSLDYAARESVGFANEKFKYWLAEKKFDDKQAGYLLAQQLIEEASEKFIPPISLVAISGSRIEISRLRNAGLKQAIDKNPQITFRQLVYSNWDKKKSRYKAEKLMLRYPDTRIIWAASDITALASYQALLKLNKKPGEEVLVGGVDWQADIFPLMQQNVYSASVGGQVLAATSALAYLYDYYNGIDKDLLKKMPNLKIDIITTKNHQLLETIQTIDWRNIDFKKMTIKHNPEAAFTPIGLSTLLQSESAL